MDDDTKTSAPAPGGNENRGGRPTLYEPAYAEDARKICQLFGATDQELAEFLEVSVRTIQSWKLEHPKFAAAIRRGKVVADAEVADRLLMRARGYKHVDYHFHVVNGKLQHKRYVKHYAPDVMACMYWLNNRQRKHWKTRQNVEHSVITENFARAIELGMFTDDELEQISAGKITRDLLGRISAASRTSSDTGVSGT